MRDLARRGTRGSRRARPRRAASPARARAGSASGGLERAHLELQPVAEALDAAEHAHRVALAEARVEQLDVGPDARLDAAARVDELQREVRRAAASCAAAPSARPRRRPRRPGPRPATRSRSRRESRPERLVGSGPVAEVKPFRAVRYGERAGPLDDLVAPPYDVISPAEREELAARSPHNVVHLTLPDDEAEAGRRWRDWRERRRRSRDEDEPGCLVALAGLRRPRRRRAHARGPRRRAARPSRTRTASSCRTSARTAGRRRAACACCARSRPARADLPPLRGRAAGEPPEREPDLEVEGARLWRLPADGITEAFADRQLLIADGHHRYETALAFHDEDGTPESAYVLAVLVSLDDPGLMIFPTHRVFEHEPVERLAGERAAGSTRARALDDVPGDRAAAVVYRDGGCELAVDGERARRRSSSTASATRASATRPTGDEAVRAVDAGEAEVAVLMRPDPDRGRLRRRPARRDDAAEEHLLLSEARLRPSVPTRCDRLARASAARRSRTCAACCVELPTRDEREPVVGDGEGGDETTAIDAAAETRDPRARCSAIEGTTHRLRGGRRASATARPRIVVDPIDGSLNAKRGIPFFSVSIAVADGDDDGRRLLRLRLRLRHRRGVDRPSAARARC